MATRKQAARKTPTKLKYIGAGAYWPNIPARDIEKPEEIARYWPQIQELQAPAKDKEKKAVVKLYEPSYEPVKPPDATEAEEK